MNNNAILAQLVSVKTPQAAREPASADSKLFGRLVAEQANSDRRSLPGLLDGGRRETADEMPKDATKTLMPPPRPRDMALFDRKGHVGHADPDGVKPPDGTKPDIGMSVSIDQPKIEGVEGAVPKAGRIDRLSSAVTGPDADGSLEAGVVDASRREVDPDHPDRQTTGDVGERISDDITRPIDIPAKADDDPPVEPKPVEPVDAKAGDAMQPNGIAANPAPLAAAMLNTGRTASTTADRLKQAGHEGRGSEHGTRAINMDVVNPSTERTPDRASTGAQAQSPDQIIAPKADRGQAIEPRDIPALSRGVAPESGATPTAGLMASNAGELTQSTVSFLKAVDAHSNWTGQAKLVSVNAQARPGATGGELQSIRLQLHPRELGMVEATLKLAGDKISLVLRAETESTQLSLMRDIQAIQNALKHSGFQIDDVLVTGTQRDTGSEAGERSFFDDRANSERNAEQEERRGAPMADREARLDHDQSDEREGPDAGGVYI